MGLRTVLESKKAAIVNEWFEAVTATYPSDTASFLQNQKDDISNPVGSTTLTGLNKIFEELLGGMDRERLIRSLDPIIRIRAVQNFSPSNAAGIIFLLKKVIRNKIQIDRQDHQRMMDLLDFESRVDDLGLLAFDVYMECREKIFDLRTNEEKRTFYKAFERAGLVKEIPDEGPGLETNNINILTKVPGGK
jgi:hypothetical protein